MIAVRSAGRAAARFARGHAYSELTSTRGCGRGRGTTLPPTPRPHTPTRLARREGGRAPPPRWRTWPCHSAIALPSDSHSRRVPAQSLFAACSMPLRREAHTHTPRPRPTGRGRGAVWAGSNLFETLSFFLMARLVREHLVQDARHTHTPRPRPTGRGRGVVWGRPWLTPAGSGYCRCLCFDFHRLRNYILGIFSASLGRFVIGLGFLLLSSRFVGPLFSLKLSAPKSVYLV